MIARVATRTRERKERSHGRKRKKVLRNASTSRNISKLRKKSRRGLPREDFSRVTLESTLITGIALSFPLRALRST